MTSTVSAFEPQRARALVRRTEFCHALEHGSWVLLDRCLLSDHGTFAVGKPVTRFPPRRSVRAR